MATGPEFEPQLAVNHVLLSNGFHHYKTVKVCELSGNDRPEQQRALFTLNTRSPLLPSTPADTLDVVSITAV